MSNSPKGKLPYGFKPIPNGMISDITFDMNYERFYVSHRVMSQYELDFGDKIGLAYDYQNDKLLIDTKATTFMIDRRGYVTSKRFSQELKRKSTNYRDMRIRYTLIPEESDDRFIVFKEGWLD